MKRYILKRNAKTYNVVENSIVESKSQLLGGSRFYGNLVFIPIGETIIPMIKVLNAPKNSWSWESDLLENYVRINDTKIIGGTITLPTSSSMSRKSNSKITDSKHSNIGDYPQYGDAEHSNFNFWETLSSLGNKDVSLEDMKKAYEASGSKMQFKDWIKTPQATSMANKILELGIGLAFSNNGDNNNKNGNDKSTPFPASKDEDKGGDDDNDDDNSGVEILGMKPLTFGLVATATLLIIGVTVIVLTSKKIKK